MHSPCVLAGTLAHDCWHCAAMLIRACDCMKPQAQIAFAMTRINATLHEHGLPVAMRSSLAGVHWSGQSHRLVYWVIRLFCSALTRLSVQKVQPEP